MPRSKMPKRIFPKGMPPRAAASEYQSQGKAGTVTIGAEFAGHSVPTPDHTYSSEDYIVVEAGILWSGRRADQAVARRFFPARQRQEGCFAQRALRAGFPFPQRSRMAAAGVTEDAKASKSSLTTGGGGMAAATSFRPFLPRCLFRCGARWNSTFKSLPCRKATVPCPRPDCSSSDTAAKQTASNPWNSSTTAPPAGNLDAGTVMR